MANLKVSERRRLARVAALELLAAGTPADELTLRMIAEKQDVPLSTLTYAYRSIGLLYVDLVAEFEARLTEAVWGKVGKGGLRAELQKHAKQIIVETADDGGSVAMLRFMVSRLVNGSDAPTRPDVPRWEGYDGTPVATEAIRKIGAKAGEVYRLPDEVVATVLRIALDGALIRYLATGDANVWYRESMACVDAIVLAADPRPAGQEFAEASFKIPNYSRLKLN